MSIKVVQPDERRQDPELAQIESVLDGVFGRLVSAWKKFLVLAVIGLLMWVFVMPNISAWWQYILYGAFMLFQLFFAIIFMIVQFVALFWFLGRPRMYWIMPGETGVGFKDYKGNPEVLEVARRVVTLLRGVKEFRQMGGEVTRGVLLIGPPGTGKSYLAQCISTEAGIPFGYLSAPSIQGMFWGMDVLRVWGLYNKARKLARKYGACILFLDEIDAIGKSRSGMGGMGMGAMGGMFGGGGGALNELLNQMDPLPRDDSLKAKLLRKLGLRTGKAQIPAVLTMGATNIAEVLDPALLRPGRFDRKIVVDYPDFDGRKELIEYYLNKVVHDDMDLDRLSNDTIGYTPVAIKHVINEAVVNAHFNGRDKITYQDISRAREVNEWGLRQPLKSQTIEERRMIAYHETGHAIAQYYIGAEYQDEPFSKVTVIRHGQALGLSQGKPTHEKHVRDKNWYLADIQICLASRAAEELFCDMASDGVYSDFQIATLRAGQMIGLAGMNGSFYSAAAFGQFAPDAPAKREIDKLLKEQYRLVKRLLDEHRDECIAIAETLNDRLELDAEEFEAIIREVRRRSQPGESFLKVPAMDAPAQSLDFGVLGPVRDDLPRFPARPKPRPQPVITNSAAAAMPPPEPPPVGPPEHSA